MTKYLNINDKKISVNLCLFLKFLHYYKNKTYSGLIKYSNGSFSVIKAIHGMLPGYLYRNTILPNSKLNKFYTGSIIFLKWVSRTIIFSNIYNNSSNKVMLSKAPGTFCVYINTDEDKEYTRVKIPSGEVKVLYNFVFVTLGRNSNILNKRRVLGKAGANIFAGYKSSVRGIAMNPVDHPHGGRAKTNSPEKTPWNKIAKKNK